jgi:hypothetical protein
VARRLGSGARLLQLDLGGDLRYDEKLIRAVSRNREAPTWPAADGGGWG